MGAVAPQMQFSDLSAPGTPSPQPGVISVSKDLEEDQAPHAVEVSHTQTHKRTTYNNCQLLVNGLQRQTQWLIGFSMSTEQALET